MRFPELLTLLHRPMLIHPASHASYLQMFQDHQAQAREEFRAARPLKDFCGQDMPQAETVGGIFRLPIDGPMGRGLGEFEKQCGCVDYGDIIDELDQFEEDPNARAAILNFDSPGGACQGLKAVRDRIHACDKPVIAFSAGIVCSAAYDLAICCDEFWATADADVGSLGVYCYALDDSQRYADAGLKPILISSGKYKGQGAPGMPYTKDQLALMQEEVDELSEEFFARVEEARGGVSREDMEGQSFQGHRALEKGLIDGIANDISEVAARL
jgi:ClpP class serine protease